MPDSGGSSGETGDPFQQLFGSGEDLGAALRHIGDLLAGSSGPVNWKLARETALATAAEDPPVIDRETARVVDSVQLADHWLDLATALPSGVRSSEAWSRRRWIELTIPAWTQLVEPVASRVVEALGAALPAEMQQVAGPVVGMLGQLGALMFGGQVGQALGQLATEVVAVSDVGLPLGPAGVAALLPVNVIAFGAGLEIPETDVWLFLALREAAHHRLFAHVPWLRAHLFDSVAAYARGTSIDQASLEAAVRELDPTDPTSAQRLLGEGLFRPQTSPAQQSALNRLETALALVEGWVDQVVSAAGDDRLPSTAALRETVRRRRATGGPAEQTFAALVGLELRPRRLREAARLWAALEERGGIAGRDEIWAHPDLLPSAEDLADPEGFAARRDGDGQTFGFGADGDPSGESGP